MLCLCTIALVALAPFLFYFLRWFTQPVVQSFRYAHPFTYHHTYTSYDNKSKENKHEFPSLYDDASVYMSLIAPAYNEQDRLDTMMTETMNYLESRRSQEPSFTYEVIIVSDGSKDITDEVALQWVKKYGTDKVRLLSLGQNQGKGGAVQQGMLHARGEYVLMVDADGATKISDLFKVEQNVKKIQKDGQGIGVGSRAHLAEEAVAQRKWYRNILMYGFNFLVSFLCVRGIKDTQCGFKLFTRKTAQYLFANQKLRRWSFDVELLYLARGANIPMAEVSVNWQEIPGSKVNLIESTFLMARDLILIRVCYMFKIWSIHTPSQIPTLLKQYKQKQQ